MIEGIKVSDKWAPISGSPIVYVSRVQTRNRHLVLTREQSSIYHKEKLIYMKQAEENANFSTLEIWDQLDSWLASYGQKVSLDII